MSEEKPMEVNLSEQIFKAMPYAMLLLSEALCMSATDGMQDSH